MCGIVGLVGQVQPFAAAFPNALDSIAHRGPDGSGMHSDDDVLLGHRRLAIIDLSDGGDQPMRDPDTGNWIIFNGEIYNYLEVRAELQQLGVLFRSRSDTEVLLKAFAQWGTAMFDRLNGMWAFAIWNERSKRMLLARDRFGVKPLYLARVGRALAFASEPKALLALDPSLGAPNPTALYEFFVDSRSQYADRSFYAGITALPPASYALVSPNQLDVRAVPYWRYPSADEDSSHGTAATEADRFSDLFDSAVKLRLRSDVPLGLTLSGGLDSSAVLLAATSQSGAPPFCMTSVYGDAGQGELHWAQHASAHVGAKLEAVKADLGDWFSTLERIVWHMDGPGYTPAVFPLWTIMAESRRRGVPVLLEGQGADELLGGYTQYSAVAALGALRAMAKGRGSVGNAVNAVDGLFKLVSPRVGALWMARLAARPLADRIGPRAGRLRLVAPIAAHAPADLDPVAPSMPPLFEALYADHSRDVLPALLHYGDAISMAQGIETRLPFMDYRLVEWVFRKMPSLIANGFSKVPIRAYLRAGGLETIADRRDKVGYRTPLAELLAGPTGRASLDEMMLPSAPLWTYLDRARAKPVLSKALRGDQGALFHTYKLLTTNLWLMQKGSSGALRNASIRSPAHVTASLAI